MASTIDFGALTLNTEEARASSECVFEQAFSRPELTRIHDIQTGVEMDRFIPILGQYGLIGKLDPGGCSVNTESGQIPVTQKTWTPKLISARIEHCEADLPTLLKFWKKSKIAAGTWETIDSEMIAFVNDRALEAVNNSIILKAEFADTAADTVANGGTLTNGTTKTYFNMLNGMWKQIFTDQALPVPLTYRWTITENSGVTYAAQLALAADAALNAFRKTYENIDPRAFEGGQLVFQVTKSLMDNWKAYLEDKSLVFTLDRAENGATIFNYRGIPIVERPDWDRIIRTYYDNGTTYDLPHRLILTDLKNIPIGTSDSESLSELRSFYDQVTKKHYIDIAYKVDCKILQEALIACAY